MEVPVPQNANLTSPDGKIAVEVKLSPEGAAQYRILREGKPVLETSRLGLVRDDADFTTGLKVAAPSTRTVVKESYELLTSKRRVNHYHAIRETHHFATAAGKKMDVVFQVSNDGIAFRYVFPEQSGELRRIAREATSFKTLPGTVGWLQPMSVPKTGFAQTNPSYEEDYRREIAAGTPSPTGRACPCTSTAPACSTRSSL